MIANKMFLPLVILSYLCVLSNGSAGIRAINADIILRDMPMQDESAATGSACCAAPVSDSPKIPSSALWELSQMTNEDFVKKYSPDEETMPPPPGNGLVVIQAAERMGVPAALPPATRMRESFTAELIPDEKFVNLDNHSPHYLMAASGDQEPPATNFRFSRILTVNAPAVEIVQMADNARCVPNDAVVPLPKPNNHSLVIYPQCTTVKQCGGCCGDSGLVCKPTARQNIKRKASHLAYINGRLRVVDSNVVVSLEEHTECACVCRQNASDCHVNQVYEAASCRCTCRNPEKAANCGPNRIWDAERCECKCPNSSGTCPVGFFFESGFFCSCLPNSGYRQSKSAAAVSHALSPAWTNPSVMSSTPADGVRQDAGFIPRRKLRNG
ncbi:uncharacterized protein LOC129589966 [Paramacrobiotus metropolitanus]|uniref:uncharacterized protein LOC129589966 n=1 Tax=Paramacrobiotus metropolitanus TaxID=2943436 RepID=UPI002445C2AB|nr:uncharacterized protein LOC129589966 [Paramacrobiotus metropolitanus]